MKTKLLTFGEALEQMKKGKKVARDGFLHHPVWIRDDEIVVIGAYDKILERFIAMVHYRADYKDILAEDWRVVE